MTCVLLVEDDSFKSDEIQTLLETLDKPPRIRLAKSVSAAIVALKEQSFELVVLDMALPSHTATPGDGAPLSLLTGGLEVLFELQTLNRRDPCIVVTQYPEIEICGNFYSLEEASRAIEENYDIKIRGCVEYAESSTHWRTTLTNLYSQICAS